MFKEGLKIGNQKLLEQRIFFFRQLAVILQSGLSILRGLEILSLRKENTIAMLCYRLRQNLLRGQSFANAMKSETFFPELACSLVRSGEECGELAKVLEELADYYERQAKLKNFVLKAMLYPLFLLFMSVLVFFVFLIFILPALASTYEAMQLQPRGVLLFMLALSEHAFIVLLLFVMLVVLAFIGRKKIIYFILRYSFLRDFYILLQEIRFCKLLALLLESGMTIVYAVQLISETSNNNVQKAQWCLFANRLQRGAELAEVMENEFTSITVDLVRIGSLTGTMPEMLCQAASINEQNLLQNLEKLKEFLGPALLLLVALFIAIIVYTIVGPLFDMINMLPE